MNRYVGGKERLPYAGNYTKVSLEVVYWLGGAIVYIYLASKLFSYAYQSVRRNGAYGAGRQIVRQNCMIDFS